MARTSRKKTDDPVLIEGVKELHAAGTSRAQIAITLGMSPATVGIIADNLGIEFDRSATIKATQAKTADNKARRADIADRLYAAAERELARLEANEYTHRVNAGQNSFVVTDTVPNADEVRNHTQAVYSALAAAAKLEALDIEPGTVAAKSTLATIADALGIPRRTA